MNTSGQWNTLITKGSFPTHFTGTIIRGATFSVFASFIIVLANGNGAGIEPIYFIFIVRFFPTRLANDFTVIIADVPIGFLKPP